jgi:hypothetical protein
MSCGPRVSTQRPDDTGSADIASVSQATSNGIVPTEQGRRHIGTETNVEGWGIDLHIDKRYLVWRGVALGWKRWSARGWSRGDEVQLIERREEKLAGTNLTSRMKI